MEQVTRDTPDILEYLDFEYYDWCWYNNNARLGEPKLGRWLGVAHHMGALMMYWILTEQGTVIACSTVSRLTLLEAHVENTKVQLQAFDAAMKEQMNDPANVINEGGRIIPGTGQIIPMRMTLTIKLNSMTLYQMAKQRKQMRSSPGV